ncbi:MAG: virulence RhuM family protein [Bacteroidales bacterium]|nr:virulence RhuM family protein [Bacteroidales bacterium]
MEENNMTGEIVVYQPDEITRLEVRVEGETVWLNRHQLAELFGRDVKTIGKHIKNALNEELEEMPVVANFATTATDGKTYYVEHYNLDMVLSIGYRVKSSRGVQFRRWANLILKKYLLSGNLTSNRLSILENRVNLKFIEHEHRLDEHQKQIDFFVRTSLPPVEGIFYDGQIFDAYVFVAELIKSARKRIVLIDNYIDESVLVTLSKRAAAVKAEIRTGHLSRQLQLDIQKHNSQYPPINIVQMPNIHDRFLIVDDDVYHIGASLKDLGKKLFAFSKMGLSPSMLI